jgi:hypothetical protein
VHDKILNEAIHLFLSLDRKSRRKTDDTNDFHDRISHDFLTEFPFFLSYHYCLSGKMIDELSFGKILFENIPVSLATFSNILVFAQSEFDKHGCLSKYWDLWNVIANHIKPSITEWANSDDNLYKNEEESFIASFLKVWYWPDKDDWVKELHDLLMMNKTNFVRFIKETIVNPKVFDAFARLFFAFPDLFEEEGIEILVKNFVSENINDTDYISSTTARYYLECILYRYIHQHQLSTVPTHKIDALIKVLDTIVDKGSPCAFFLRESLFTRISSHDLQEKE